MNEANYNLWKLIWPLLLIYCVISQILALYFWYVYAQNAEFLDAMFIGPIVGEFKGLLWPFFI